MNIERRDNQFVLIVDDNEQVWNPNEGITPEQVEVTLAQFADDGEENLGRKLVALKSLCTIVNDSDLGDKTDDNKTVDGEEPPADTGDNPPVQDPTPNEPVEEPLPPADDGGDEKDEIDDGVEDPKPQDPPANGEQKELPKETPEPPAQDDTAIKPPAYRSILNHDVEMTLEEFDAQSMNEDGKAPQVEHTLTNRGLEVKINGAYYIYQTADADDKIETYETKFASIAKHSVGKALGWLEQQRRSGKLTSTKISSESRSKVWEFEIKKALEAVAQKYKCKLEDFSVLPDEEDYLVEFTLTGEDGKQSSGSINANLYAEDWFIQVTGECPLNKEGAGLDRLKAVFSEW